MVEEQRALLGAAEVLGVELPASEPPPAASGDQRVDFDHLVDLTAAPRILRGSAFQAPPPAPFEEMGQPFLAPPKPRVSPTLRRAGYLTALALGAGLSWMAMSPGAGTPETAPEPIAAAAPAAVEMAPPAIVAPEAAAIEANVAPEAAAMPEATEVVAEEAVTEPTTVTETEGEIAIAQRSATPRNTATAAPAAAPAATEASLGPAEAAETVTEAAVPTAAPTTPTTPTAHVPEGDRALAVDTAAEHGSVLHAVDEAVGGTSAEVAETAEVTETAEAAPSVSRADVSAAMNDIRGDVEACATGRHGQANVQMMVHESGRVRGVRVVGTFAGTTEGSCIARAVRGARFPAFEGADFAIHYPFRL